MIVLAPEASSGELTPARREALGELHLRRIDLSDEVRVVSEGGYGAYPRFVDTGVFTLRALA
ncbi:MAG: hypothetical protein ACTH8S_11670, partial [Brachybacterium sp.]